MSLDREEVYDASFIEGKLYVLGKTFDLRAEIPHRFVPSTSTPVFFIAHGFSADLIMGIPIHRRCRGLESNTPFSHCFEELCARSMTQKPHGTFYSVVNRKIGDLNVIMAGEIDCSMSMRLYQPIDGGMLISTLEATNVEPDLNDYIELKTVKTDPRFPPDRRTGRLPRWYMQSYLLGVPTLAVGFRDFRNNVFNVKRKLIEEVLRDAQKYVPEFDPAVSLGRAHAILSALLEHFRSLGQSISAQDKFELRVDANGDAWVTSLTNSANLAG